MPISVMYLQNRHLSPKVRAFVDWVAELFERCPLLSGREGEMGAECAFAARPDANTYRNEVAHKNVAESVV